MKKIFEPKIESVVFYYSGQDKDFNFFLKSVIHDYLIAAKEPVIVGNDEISEYEKIQ